MKTLLWLDDYRDPFDKEIEWLVFSPIGRDCQIVWVRNFNEFITHIIKNRLPTAICFDHDLGEEKTGYDCAKWLVTYCQDNNLLLPIYSSQSANPVGRKNILTLLNNYVKIIQKSNI